MSENLTIAQCERILRKAGSERIGQEAAKELARVLEEVGTTIAWKAAESVRLDKRVTMKKRDVAEASEVILAITKLHATPEKVS